MKTTLIGFVAAVLMVATFTGGAAAQQVDLSRAGGWFLPGRSGLTIAIAGDYAYFATSRSLEVVNIGNPPNPVVVGSTSNYAERVAISGNYAYLVSGYPGRLTVVDISDPTNPVQAGGVNTSDGAYGITVSGMYAYVAAYFAGLEIFDISNPNNPIYVGGALTFDAAVDVGVSDSYAYVVDGFGLQVFSIANPENPIHVGGIDYLGGFANGVAVGNAFAYVAKGSQGFCVIDISNPTNPIVVGSVTNISAYDVAVSGDRAYSASSGGALQVIDVSNPTNPVWLGSGGAFRSSSARGVAVSGNYAYVADYTYGLHVMDVSDPANPVRAGGLLTIGSSALSVAVSTNRAYVADQFRGLQVFDVSDVNYPIPLAVENFTGGSNYDVAISGNHACSLYSRDGTNYSLQVFDVSNDTSPVQVGNLAFTNLLMRLLVSGDYAYVAHEARIPHHPVFPVTCGLTVVDMSNRSNPVPVATYFVTNYPSAWGVIGGMALSGNHIYLAVAGQADNFEFEPQSAGSLRVVDLSNPANPVLADYGFDSGEILDVAAGGNDYAYIIYRTEESCHLSEPGFCYPEAGGVGAVDISNPADIVWRKSFETGQRHSQVVVSGSYLYMPPWVFDMSNPTNFVVAGTFSPGVGGLRMVVSGGHIYSAAGSSGLQIASVRPRLFVEPLAGWMQLLWTTNVGNYVLEGTTNPVAPQWDTVNGQAGVSNGFHRVTVPATNPGAYFRLRSIESP